MVEILIGSDVCPINRNAEMFRSGDAHAIFTDLLPEFQRADLAVVNLECPLIDRPQPIEKAGPVLEAEARAIGALKNASVDVVSLANNHILDHGTSGLRSTLRACASAGIAVVGLGENHGEAGLPLIRKVKGTRIALLAYAEKEFAAAGKETAGISRLSLAHFVRSLRLCQGTFDYLIVLLHAGVQHHPYPSPTLQDTCRFMIEEGAGAVICQHSHCPGCVEEYRGGHIIYGQGNLVFDRYPLRRDSFYQGFLARITIGSDLHSQLELIPYRQSDHLTGARKMEPHEAERFMADLRERSFHVLSPEFVQRQWIELCKAKRYDFYSTVSGHGRVARFLNRKLHFSDWFYGRDELLNLHNVISCESHREMLESILEMDKEVKR